MTAVVLACGELFVERALQGIRSQTVAPADVLVVGYSEASTFHDAINLAARRVRTEFFVQVDADMILDAHDRALPGDLRELFGGLYQFGIEARTRDDRSMFQDGLALLRCEGAERALVGTLALCHGLFCEAFRDGDASRKFEALEGFLTVPLPGAYRPADLLLPVSEAGV